MVTTRRGTPYVVSLVVLPALVTLSPVSSVVPAAPAAFPRFAYYSVAASREGALLDRRLEQTRRILDQVIDEAGPFLPDMTFGLRPVEQTRHRVHVVRRNEPVPFVETTTDLTYLG